MLKVNFETDKSKHMGPGARISGYESQICYFLAVWH